MESCRTWFTVGARGARPLTLRVWGPRIRLVGARLSPWADDSSISTVPEGPRPPSRYASPVRTSATAVRPASRCRKRRRFRLPEYPRPGVRPNPLSVESVQDQDERRDQEDQYQARRPPQAPAEGIEAG